MLRHASQGIAAGIAATLPMTSTMWLGFHLLPNHQKGPLPPRQITARTLGYVLPWERLSHEQKKAITLVAHYAYGGTVGCVYAILVPRQNQNVGTGMAYGLAVWAGSYLGLLPSLNILRPATRHPAERNVLMIVAHLVWGAALGGILGRTGCCARQGVSKDMGRRYASSVI
jgi:uncharacterized membrane protein YagU involved in acid resistance